MSGLKKAVGVCACLLSMVLIFGCAAQNKTAENGGGASPSATVGGASGTKEAEEQTRTVKDAKGEEVVIPANPQRIADISGSTEELLVLGFQPVLTGNTDMGNPAEVTPILKQKLQDGVSIAGWFQTEVNVEAILQAKPDLILAGPTQDGIYEQLTKIAPTVRIPYGFNAFRERFAFVAETLGKTGDMEAWMTEYEAQAQEGHDRITAVTKDETFAVVEATAKEVRIYSRTGIADLVYHDLQLPQAPGVPEPDAWGGKVTSLEGFIDLDPDHLILLADGSDNILEQSGFWSKLQAVKAGNVYRMTSLQNYNEAFFALGKKAMIAQLVDDIVKHANS